MDAVVSIIIPTFNRAEKVIKTLESIVSQSYPNIEIILVDDGSTDDTEGKVRKYIQEKYLHKRLFYYKQENKGAPSARNFGLEIAKGNLVVFFDSDDLMLPDRVLKQVKSMLNEDSDCCSCGFIYSFDGVKHIPKLNKDQGIIRSYMNWDLVGSTISWMYKKEILLDIGGYDLSYACYQDWDITFRYLIKCHKISIVGEVLNIVDNNNEGDRITSQISSLKRISNIQRFYLSVIKWSIVDSKDRRLADEVLFSYVHQITILYLNDNKMGEAKNSLYSLNQALKDSSFITKLWCNSIFFKHLFKTLIKSLLVNFKLN